VGCFECVPYCPLGAIKKSKVGTRPKAFVNQDECVECAVCLRAEICNTDAIYQPELKWPRAIRQAFSAVLIGYDALEEAGIYGYVATSGEAGVGGGRGTSEMKTNDITGRYVDGEIGLGVEFGRPCVGFYFRDVEKVAKALAKHDVEFEHYNPLTMLLDKETGMIKYKEVLNERAMSAILEVNAKQEQTLEILKTLKEAAKEIDTVLSIDIINKCKGATIPVLPMLEEAGIKIRINGKTNVGLGRPLIP
jgi:NAD-dependent dihydropyrimidine dehydrogenase PreA subunit